MCIYMSDYIHMYKYSYTQGWKQAVSRRKMRITLRVIANNFWQSES